VLAVYNVRHTVELDSWRS